MSYMLFVPTRGLVSCHTVEALTQAEIHGARPKIHFEVDQLSVARCRNKIVKKFLDSGLETLIMVDDDVVPPPGFLIPLLEPHGAYAKSFDIRAIPYPTWAPSIGFHLTAYNLTSKKSCLKPLDTRRGWDECDVVGTGCIAIDRKVLSIMGNEPFKLEDGFSEDVVFCRNAAQYDFKIGAYVGPQIAEHVRSLALGTPYLEQASRA